LFCLIGIIATVFNAFSPLSDKFINILLLQKYKNQNRRNDSVPDRYKSIQHHVATASRRNQQ